MPQTHYIIYQNPENTQKVLIMNPSGEIPIETLIANNIPDNCKYTVMPLADFTYDVAYLDALSFEGIQQEDGKPDINMDMARDVHRNYLRQERKPLLESLDIQFMRALEANNTTVQNEITAKKQLLRDIPKHPLIISATTTLELRNLTLDYLLTV